MRRVFKEEHMKLIPIDHVYVVNSNNLEERAGLYVDAETGVVYFF